MAGEKLDDARDELRAIFERETHRKADDLPLAMRALFTLHDIDATDEKFLRAQLHADNGHIRAWAIRMLTEPSSSPMLARVGSVDWR